MRSLRVLVVDDDRDLAESLEMALQGRGHRVEVANSGEDAVARFANEPFDIAFLDVRLPGINGVEALRRIRKLRPDARVVMITGYSAEENLHSARDHGALGVLRKPFSLQKLFEYLGQLELGVVLIADDDRGFADALAAMLQQQGYQTAVVHDGDEAVRRVRDNGVEALVLDLAMPKMDGLATCRELLRAGLHVPVVAMTGHADRDDDEELAALRVRKVLRKPFEPQELLDELRQILA